MEMQRQELARKWRSGKKYIPGMKLLMDNTFPMRRERILEENIRVWKVLEEYPRLKDEKSIEVQTVRLNSLVGTLGCYCI